MIETYRFLAPDFQQEEPKELVLLSIIAQSFFQPFSTEDNLLVILTALTSGSGIGFNRAMLLRAEGGELRGDFWLGPRSPEEARSIWEVLSTPGIGYVEIIQHNRGLINRSRGSLSERVRGLSYSLAEEVPRLPLLAALRREVVHVRDGRGEPSVDPRFLDLLGVEEFLCIPLFARDEILGTIVLDNAINGEPIRHKEIKLASLCGLVAGNFIYQALLHRRMVDMERLAALGEMASFMTHQLRNPVTAIGGFADQLLNGPRDEAHLRRNLEIIRGEIRRLETLLFKLAHFLKADLCSPLPFDLSSIVRSVLDSGEIRRRASAYEVALDWAEESSPVLGDATAVGEAIRNLIDNAFDATAPGGRIEIRGGRLNRLWTSLEVRDTGRGLTPEARRNLFSPFFTTKGEGLGLGLLFVKRVLDACGGRVEVESEAGKGTLFRLTFRNAQEGRTEP